MDINSEPERPPALNEVFRRVGRNLLLLQQIELLLKALLSASGFAGYASEIRTKAAQRAEEISRKTLGQLAQQYHDEVLGQDAAATPTPENPREPWFSMRFQVKTDEAAVERDRAVLLALVAERNELAHTFLSQWDLSSTADLDAVTKVLDEQRARALPVLEHIKSLLVALEKARKESGAWLMSVEGKQQIKLAVLQQSEIIQLFEQVAETSARQDGWVDLAAAGQFVHKLAPDDAMNLKARYGVRSLKKLLLKSELFEVAEGPDGGGHMRTVYRRKRPH